MKTIFKEGMNVWDALVSKTQGVVTGVDEDSAFPVVVSFKTKENVAYTKDGKIYEDWGCTLSTKPYTLTDGGFSQEAPLPNFKKDQWIWVWNGVHVVEAIRCKFARWVDYGKVEVLPGSFTTVFDSYSIVNPNKDSIENRSLVLLKEFLAIRKYGGDVSKLILCAEELIKEIKYLSNE